MAASIGLAVGLSGLAMVMVRGQFGARGVKGAFAVLIMAILALHFTGVAALRVTPFAPSQPALGPGAAALAVATALVGLLVIGAGALAYVIDKRTRRDASERLAWMAMTDLLTGLPNSLGFEAELDRRLGESEPDGRLMVVAIGFVGLDTLKQRYGRDVFDQAVRTIVQTLQQRSQGRCRHREIGQRQNTRLRLHGQ